MKINEDQPSEEKKKGFSSELPIARESATKTCILAGSVGCGTMGTLHRVVIQGKLPEAISLGKLALRAPYALTFSGWS